MGSKAGKPKLSDPSSIKKQSHKKVVLFVLLIVFYILVAFVTNQAARSQVVIEVGDSRLPMNAFAGVLSSLSSVILILLVVLFHKQGLITSLIIIAGQWPIMIQGIIRHRNLQSIPGLFASVFTIIATFAIYAGIKQIEDLQSKEIRYLEKQKLLSQRLFEQTSTSLVNAIDAKDTYSRGHSVRVAEYSVKIAGAMGKSEDEVMRIYYAALLHDVGKIGIPDTIINKKGKLTDEEFDSIREHPVFGNQILSSIGDYPYISIGAHFHHERYDGKGYPEKLKGDDIPEIARIIAVADSYDAMTSNRSYRDALPQQKVREEILKNAGTQFDPEVAKVMVSIIDQDVDYLLKERNTVQELSGRSSIYCDEYESEVSEGIILPPVTTKIRFDYSSEVKGTTKVTAPTLILFDSQDARVHRDPDAVRDLNYFEFGTIRLDGQYKCEEARKMETKVINQAKSKLRLTGRIRRQYALEAIRYADHLRIRITEGENIMEVTVALPDSTRFSYIALTGEKCEISNLSISRDYERIKEDAIPRIAEKISYIDGPQGQIPNVQIDGFRMAYSEPVPIKENMKISFHTMSLPTSRLIWHCPYVDIFHSDDGKVKGENYQEYALIRLDGENWYDKIIADNQLSVDMTSSFRSWHDWKQDNKTGYDCEITVERTGNKIILTTENLGVKVHNITTVLDGNDEIYLALTGDQCAITNIRLNTNGTIDMS